MFKEVKDSQRWLMLGEDCPAIQLRVLETTDKPMYTELLTSDKDAQFYRIACFDRDVKRCVKEWGVNPLNWGWIVPYKKPGSTRFELIPLDPQPALEESHA